MSRGLLLIDGSNIAHASNSATPLTVGDMPTQAIYGVLRTLRPMISAFTMLTPIVLWDGRSWRKDMFKEYKESRDKVAVTKNEQEIAARRAELKVQLPYVKLALKTLGIRQMHALNYEADDLAGMIVAQSADRRVMMITGDKDWVQLVRKNVAWLDPQRNEKLTEATIPQRLGWNPAKKKLMIGDGSRVEGWIGVPSARAWLEMKALMGDVSDDIPGVGGIGEKGAIELLTQFPSVASFMNQCIDHSIDTSKLPKKFLQLAEDMEKQDNFQRNMILMDLNTKMRPAPINLATTYQAKNFDGFKAVCEKFYFKSILDSFERWCEPFGVAA
jgi:DNA polymerase-1